MQCLMILVFNLMQVTCYETIDLNKPVSSIRLIAKGEDDFILEVNDNKEVFHLRKKVTKSDTWIVGSNEQLEKYQTEVCEIQQISDRNNYKK